MGRTCSKYGSRYLQIRDHIPNKGHGHETHVNSNLHKNPVFLSFRKDFPCLFSPFFLYDARTRWLSVYHILFYLPYADRAHENVSQLCAGFLDLRVNISRLRPNKGNLRPLIDPRKYEQVAPHCNANKKQLLLLEGLISQKMKTVIYFIPICLLLSHVKCVKFLCSPAFSSSKA